jgi:hypothetical protein
MNIELAVENCFDHGGGYMLSSTTQKLLDNAIRPSVPESSITRASELNDSQEQGIR